MKKKHAKKPAAGTDADFLRALKNAAFDGWRNDLCRDFADWADRQMIKTLPKNFGEMKIRDKIHAGVMARFRALAPYKTEVSESLRYMAAPPHSFLLPKITWRTADVLWLAAGDTATDYNRYTKRLLLSGIIVATTIYWLNDSSDGMEKTSAFLSRRIAHVLKIGGLLAKFKKGA